MTPHQITADAYLVRGKRFRIVYRVKTPPCDGGAKQLDPHTLGTAQSGFRGDDNNIDSFGFTRDKNFVDCVWICGRLEWPTK
jgi:hypothetical protein